MDTVRIGIMGLGNIGRLHAGYLGKGEIRRASLAAVFDVDPARLESLTVPTFTKSEDMIKSGLVDAVIIATPHYFHTTLGIEALQAGLHVLVEKPLSVHKADAEKLLAAHTNPKQVFAVMFNQRTVPHFKKIKQLIDAGELGEIRRVSWTITDWFRPEAYYASGGWRATWRGEGGGVLLNQCPHQLDLFQWMFGMPTKIRAFCHLGKYHNIEVEDEVTAYMEYANGCTAVLTTSTGEAPGTNRLEIAAEQGKLVYEKGALHFTRNEVPTATFCKESKQPFSHPAVWEVEIPVEGKGGQHIEVTQNFVDAILDGAPLIAPAAEGIRSVELANAMLYSSFKDTTVTLPLDSQAYAELLQGLIEHSTGQKKVVDVQDADMQASFR